MSKRVKDVIVTWTPEERKKFAGLIKECSEREYLLEKVSFYHSQVILDLKEASVSLHSDLEYMVNCFNLLRIQIDRLYDSSLSLYLLLKKEDGEV